jgi:hypothetical protein
MIFSRSYTLQSKKNQDEIRQYIVGQHLKVHDLDFEILVRDEDVKIIPHAETEDHIYTLPITRLRFISSGTGTIIKMRSKPRRIDIGGPYLIMIFVLFMIVAGILLFLLGEGKYTATAYLLCGIAMLIFAVLWIRLEMGYFDYIRKIKKWVQSHS